MQNNEKIWLSLYVSQLQKVHIELLPSLDADAFLNVGFLHGGVPLRRSSPTMALNLSGPIRNSSKHLQARELNQDKVNCLKEKV